jgi:hypothetical protein
VISNFLVGMNICRVYLVKKFSPLKFVGHLGSSTSHTSGISITSRKQGFCSGPILALVPALFGAWTNLCISPESNSNDVGTDQAEISPGSYETFSPGSFWKTCFKHVCSPMEPSGRIIFRSRNPPTIIVIKQACKWHPLKLYMDGDDVPP